MRRCYCDACDVEVTTENNAYLKIKEVNIPVQGKFGFVKLLGLHWDKAYTQDSIGSSDFHLCMNCFFVGIERVKNGQ